MLHFAVILPCTAVILLYILHFAMILHYIAVINAVILHYVTFHGLCYLADHYCASIIYLLNKSLITLCDISAVTPDFCRCHNSRAHTDEYT